MQLGIRWWREVRVCPALFDASEQDSPSYLEMITSDRLDAMQQVRPLAMPNHAVRVDAGVGPSSYVGYVVLDGHLFHES